MPIALANYQISIRLPRGLSPLILSIITLYIGQDILTTGQMVGILTISLSMIYMGFTQFRINKDGPKGLLLACITGIFIASYSMVDALGTRLTGDAMMYFSSSTILNVLLMAIYSMMFHKHAVMSIISNGKKPFFIGGTASLSGLCDGVVGLPSCRRLLLFHLCGKHQLFLP